MTGTTEVDEGEFDYGEAFLSANANRRYLAIQMADVLRELFRASVRQDGSGAARAAERMNFVSDLLTRCEEKPSWWDLFDSALAIIRQQVSEHESDRDFYAAEQGTKLYLEFLADDAFAAARVSKLRTTFRQACRER